VWLIGGDYGFSFLHGSPVQRFAEFFYCALERGDFRQSSTLSGWL
jgi:hypothetical protein